MTLLDYYRRSYTADWLYDYAEGETYRRGRKQIEDLRNDIAGNGARLEIFDACKWAAFDGKKMPDFGEIAVVSADRAFLIEAIAYHDTQAQHYWSKASEMMDKIHKTDTSTTTKYHYHTALLARLREQQARLKEATPA